MATNTAQLLSFDASGQVAKTIVYSKWRGVPYTRKYVVPANPQTTEQTSTRSVFTWCSNVWKNAPTLFQAPWTLFSSGQPFYNRNAFMGQNVKALRPGDDLTSWIASPGAKGGVAPVSVSASASGTTVTVTFGKPTAPSGWTLTNLVAAIMLNDDPHTSTAYDMVANSAAGSGTTVALASSPVGACQVAGWLQWTKSDGTTAYSASTNTTVTVT